VPRYVIEGVVVCSCQMGREGGSGKVSVAKVSQVLGRYNGFRRYTEKKSRSTETYRSTAEIHTWACNIFGEEVTAARTVCRLQRFNIQYSWSIKVEELNIVLSSSEVRSLL